MKFRPFEQFFFSSWPKIYQISCWLSYCRKKAAKCHESSVTPASNKLFLGDVKKIKISSFDGETKAIDQRKRIVKTAASENLASAA